MVRLAVELSPDVWLELTEPPIPNRRISRVRVGTLRAAQRITARSADQVFLDIAIHLGPDTATATAQYERLHPGWQYAAGGDRIVHPGSGRSVAGLIWDIHAAGVADGVTLRSDSTPDLLREVTETVLPELAARGVRFQQLARTA